MSITEASTKTLIIPALERDFREGALYDARSERMVEGFSLWNADDLNKIDVRRNDSTHYLMNASDTLSETFKGLEMSASVKLSVLSGLIELGGGSVSYLKKEKNTRGKCSVQVKCFFKTGYKEMSMDQIRNIRYLDVARTGNNNTATHFVTKIQYGAVAIFTFTKPFQSEEEERQVKAKADLQFCGKKFKSLLDGSYERNYRNYSSHSQIKCEFKSFGLSLSEALPTTYDEAVKFVGSFARTAKKSFARHGGEALGVPCTVWLYPLVLLPGCADAPKLHCDFNSEQASQWIKIFEDYDDLEESLQKNKQLNPDYQSLKERADQLRSDSTAELREMLVEIRSTGLSTERIKFWLSPKIKLEYRYIELMLESMGGNRKTLKNENENVKKTLSELKAVLDAGKKRI